MNATRRLLKYFVPYWGYLAIGIVYIVATSLVT